MKRVMLEYNGETSGGYTNGGIYQAVGEKNFVILNDYGERVHLPDDHGFRVLGVNKQPDELKKEWLKMALSTPGLQSEYMMISAANKYYEYLSE